MSPTSKPAKAMKDPGEGKTTAGRRAAGFTDEERDAMKERVKELRSGSDEADGERIVLEKISTFKGPDCTMGERLHRVIMASAPGLSPRLWYGMPAYAKDGKMICFFQPAAKFRTRYATLGFSDKAKLDDGRIWPVAFALKELTPAEETRIKALVAKAAG